MVNDTGGPVRIQKALSSAGLMSRRRAEDAIRARRVRVDGKVAVLGDRVDPVTADVTIDGIIVPVAPARVTYVVNKPVGVISTTDDPGGRPTVIELVPSEPRVWPIGRLDADSEGLLFLSNDGTLTNLVTHPRYEIHKTYVVLFGTDIPTRAVRAFEAGMELEDGPARAISARVVDRSPGRTLVEMVLGEGRNRQIRRMAEMLGLDVVRLIRIAIGPIRDRKLASGGFRTLTLEEVTSLYRAAGPI